MDELEIKTRLVELLALKLHIVERINELEAQLSSKELAEE